MRYAITMRTYGQDGMSKRDITHIVRADTPEKAAESVYLSVDEHTASVQVYECSDESVGEYMVKKSVRIHKELTQTYPGKSR